MMDFLKSILHPLRIIYRKAKLYAKVNLVKTLYFNFKKFPFSQAKKLPVIFYGKVTFQDISGEIIINAPFKRGMIGYGQSFEQQKTYKGTAEIVLRGKLVFNGRAQIGKDVFLFVGENAVCEFGNMGCLGSDVKLICTQKIVIGEWSGIGYESQVIDTNSHPMMDSITGEHYPLSGEIRIGSHNSISNRVSIMPNTRTPDYCVIASNTLCNKDYSALGNNILIGGVPAKLLKSNYTRDWDREKELLKLYKIIEY